MLYDRTCTRGLGPLGLSHSWDAGGRLYSLLGRFDAWIGVSSWTEALDWLGATAPDRPIASIQYWGHGLPGAVLIDHDPIHASSLTGPLEGRFTRVRERLGPESLWWFRTCSTLAGARGHHFARRWAGFFNCAVAGHTHVIGPWQSGLHRLAPGATPHWSRSEGLIEGGPPTRTQPSAPWLPNTITCLQGEVPIHW